MIVQRVGLYENKNALNCVLRWMSVDNAIMFSIRGISTTIRGNLESELAAPYDELAPFIKTIAEQREHMARQLTDL